ncbi:MAG: hypothetical protein ABEI57_02075 [Halapricum sp.]
MQFRDDRRGQAIQIGAVLLLGALVLAFSIYQATVVPAQNSKVEFQHSQHVERQLQDLRNAIVTTGQTGDGRSLSIQLGTDYPPRLIALNPPPATGSLATVGTTNASVNATIAHARANGETGDFWNGTNRTYNTGALAYRPGYNEYGGAPVTWYENSVLFDQFRTANLTTTGQRLIDGDRISLVTLNGSYYASQEGSVSLDLRGVSTSSTTVSVTNATASSNVTITVPTRLTGSDWRSLLSEQMTVGHVANVTTTAVPGAEYRLVHVVLDRGVTYQLHIARVGFGSKVVRPDPAYLTTVGGNGTTVPEGGKTQLTVQVRDALDNPKQDVRVLAGSQWDNATVTPNAGVSDSDGRVTFTYTAPNISGAGQRVDHVQVSLNTALSSAVNGSIFDGSTATNVSLAVRVDNSDGSGLRSGGNSAYTVFWKNPAPGQSGVTCTGGANGYCTVDTSRTSSVTLTADTDPTVDGGRIQYAVNNSTVGSVAPTVNQTTADGIAKTTLSLSKTGNISVYASGGGSGDRLDLRVVNTSSPIDTFNDGNINEYTGDTNQFAAATSPTYEGSWALEASPTGNALKRITSTTGLPNYPNQGDTFAYDFNVTSTGNKNDFRGVVGFGETPGGNHYEVRLVQQSATTYVLEVDNGATVSTSSAFSLNDNQWYETSVDWGASTVDVTLSDTSGTTIVTQSVANAGDSGSDYLAFGSQRGTIVFDDVRKTS